MDNNAEKTNAPKKGGKDPGATSDDRSADVRDGKEERKLSEWEKKQVGRRQLRKRSPIRRKVETAWKLRGAEDRPAACRLPCAPPNSVK